MIEINLTNFITVGLMAVLAWVAVHWIASFSGLSGKIPGIDAD